MEIEFVVAFFTGIFNFLRDFLEEVQHHRGGVEE